MFRGVPAGDSLAGTTARGSEVRKNNAAISTDLPIGWNRDYLMSRGAVRA
jgi:hypothetical protein